MAARTPRAASSRNSSRRTSTVGLELLRQIADLDAVIVAIGGGGLCSGIGAAFKQVRPQCEVLAVEPRGADTMYRSFEHGSPQTLEKVRTIADSLAPPQLQNLWNGIEVYAALLAGRDP